MQTTLPAKIRTDETVGDDQRHYNRFIKSFNGRDPFHVRLVHCILIMRMAGTNRAYHQITKNHKIGEIISIYA